jgi:hypothetical protein
MLSLKLKAGSLHCASAVIVPELYLPAPNVDLSRFAVVACDQFTSEPDYWEETARIAGQMPSALHLVLPEYFLEHPGDLPVEQRIKAINTTMRAYLEQGILKSIGTAAVVLKRTTPGRSGRLGLVLAIDLEHYDFTPGNHQLIRSTEGTVLERIPPRMAIRKDALLELPHVQLLIDDPDRTVIEPLFAATASEKNCLYNTDLMQGGGEITGYRADADSPALLTALLCLSELKNRKKNQLLFAVGDGNHSLATAKSHYESQKLLFGPDHPARYALVEIINIHDEGLVFEPIHRVVFDIEAADFRDEAQRFFGEGSLTFSDEITDLKTSLNAPTDDSILMFPILQPDGYRLMRLSVTGEPLHAAIITRFLDDLVQRYSCRIDYIHGATVVAALAARGATGILLPAMDKSRFFDTIARDGILPRKTFSMGEPYEKRYYLEARRITRSDPKL